MNESEVLWARPYCHHFTDERTEAYTTISGGLVWPTQVYLTPEPKQYLLLQQSVELLGSDASHSAVRVCLCVCLLLLLSENRELQYKLTH